MKEKLKNIKNKILSYFSGFGPSSDLIVVFFRQLSEMINSGIPIFMALKIFHKQIDNKRFKKTIEDLIYYLSKEGLPLSRSMAKLPHIFSPVYIAMVTAGENGGFLQNALQKISEESENENKLKKRFYSTITYPIFIIVSSAIAMIITLRYILPSFSPMLRSLNIDLPLPTKILNLTLIVFNHPLTILVFIISAILFFKIFKSPKGKVALEVFCLKVPIIGSAMRYAVIVRFSRMYALLCDSGLPIFQSLKLLSKSLGSPFYEKKLMGIVEDVKSGMTLSSAIAKPKLFPPIVTSMIRVGEESGRMSVALKKLSHFYELEIEHIMNKFFSLLEPVLLIYMGVLVAFVIISIFLPMYQIVTNMK